MCAAAGPPPPPSRPAQGGVSRDQQPALKARVGRPRLNLQGARALATCRFPCSEAAKTTADPTRQRRDKLERATPSRTLSHGFGDHARSHQAQGLPPWLNAPGRRSRRHCLPPEAPPLHPLARLWGVRPKGGTPKRHDDTFHQCAEAVLGGLRKTLPDKGEAFRDTGTNNFRGVSHTQYTVIQNTNQQVNSVA